jgi:hypothetical protein
MYRLLLPFGDPLAGARRYRSNKTGTILVRYEKEESDDESKAQSQEES